MKYVKYYFVLLFFCTVSTLSLAANWEYHVKTLLIAGDDKYLANELNKLGGQGWELVNCTSPAKGGKLVCTFKREKSK